MTHYDPFMMVSVGLFGCAVSIHNEDLKCCVQNYRVTYKYENMSQLGKEHFSYIETNIRAAKSC